MLTTLLSIFFFAHAQDASVCSYQYRPDSLKIEWTAYKFTEKKGVKASFPIFKLNAPESATAVQELFEKTSVEIDPLGVDSGDAGRDENLKKSFFKKMIGTKIKGTVIAFAPTISKIKIEMNGKSKVVPFRMKIEGAKYLGETDIDILDFKMQKSLDSINQTCYDLHKGSDGKSKTWSQVSLALSAEIIENCPNKK